MNYLLSGELERGHRNASPDSNRTSKNMSSKFLSRNENGRRYRKMDFSGTRVAPNIHSIPDYRKSNVLLTFRGHATKAEGSQFTRAFLRTSPWKDTKSRRFDNLLILPSASTR